jgi:4-amino-4-deoxy-L-arabinose transferase-like glycosyltransferase
MVLRWAPPAILVGLSAALFAYLLARFPYNGFYGQDAYAYYYQAEALWRELTGQAEPPWAQFTANGLYWPVGYHLHLLPGFLLGWPGMGRVITLALSALTPAVLYLLAGEIWYTATARQRIASGLVAGAVLVLTGTYTRTGLSLMSDVPSVFWGTLAIYCCLKAWPPVEQTHAARSTGIWALAAGMLLGVAILVRYSAALLLPALIVYLLARGYNQRRPVLSQHREQQRARWQPEILWAALGLTIALLPQVAYSLTHEPGPALRAWSLDNLFSTTVSGPDGSATYTLPMLAFYLLSTLVNVGGGFLSPLYLPVLAFGVWVLARQRNLAILSLIFAWWLIPVLAYGGTPYQTHRFALTFVPVLALFVGVGASTALFRLLQEIRSRTHQPASRRVSMGLAATLMLVALSIGLAQGWRSVEQWAAMHSAFNVQEQQVVALAREAVATSGQEGTPRVVCFGFSAPLYHYTRWPILDFFAHDEADIREFLAAPGPHVLVLPEESMSTQWAGTPPGARWQWLQNTYKLSRQGQSGAFTVYVIGDRR